MAIDVQGLVEEAKKKRAAAKAAADAAKAEASKNKVKTKKADAITRQANNKFDYANSLEGTIIDLEGRLQAYITRLSRGDELSPVDQKEFDRLSKQYDSVTAAYTKAMAEGNQILDTLPADAKPSIKPTKKETTAGISPEDTGRTATDQEVAATVEGQNKTLDALLTNARSYLAKLDDAGRLQWAKVLTDAGFPVPAVGGIGNLDSLVAQYTAAITSAKNYNTTNAQLIKDGILQPLDVQSFLSQKTAYVNQVKGLGGKGAGAGGVDISQRISDPTQAAATIQGVFSTVLGREATDKEVGALTKILNDFEKNNPFRTVDGKTTGGLDRDQFITDLIKKGTYAGNKKAYPGILSGLAKEAAGKKAGVEEKKTLTNQQAIMETAMNNGIKLSDAQVQAYLNGIKAGKSIEAIQQEIRNIASLGQPENVAKMIASGTDLSSIYQPYRNRMAAVLELPADQINMDDPSLRTAIRPEGPMSLYDYEKALRKDVRWQYTNNAREEVSNAALRVLKDFGFQG